MPGLYLREMTDPKVYEFSKHIAALCVTHHINVDKLAAKLGVDPTNLQMMINGHAIPTRAVIEGLAKELDFDVRYLEKLVDQIRKDMA
jgi:transcriptional regulator with XRE-family HTH domain